MRNIELLTTVFLVEPTKFEEAIDSSNGKRASNDCKNTAHRDHQASEPFFSTGNQSRCSDSDPRNYRTWQIEQRGVYSAESKVVQNNISVTLDSTVRQDREHNGSKKQPEVDVCHTGEKFVPTPVILHLLVLHIFGVILLLGFCKETGLRWRIWEEKEDSETPHKCDAPINDKNISPWGQLSGDVTQTKR
ncbi:hypothetical protein OGATHE_004226 [Ogataea polymorpha]|uniref:Uncharacterized protein n=1 Tax=Ogataea polymorpha TaxID=460523 RepID=A0A9P8P0H0_9ASCO|nr:hypothetical protein OGATHE_004226 [Ogataea polymorpha]